VKEKDLGWISVVGLPKGEVEIKAPFKVRFEKGRGEPKKRKKKPGVGEGGLRQS